MGSLYLLIVVACVFFLSLVEINNRHVLRIAIFLCFSPDFQKQIVSSLTIQQKKTHWNLIDSTGKRQYTPSNYKRPDKRHSSTLSIDSEDNSECTPQSFIALVSSNVSKVIVRCYRCSSFIQCQGRVNCYPCYWCQQCSGVVNSLLLYWFL